MLAAGINYVYWIHFFFIGICEMFICAKHSQLLLLGAFAGPIAAKYFFLHEVGDLSSMNIMLNMDDYQLLILNHEWNGGPNGCLRSD